jgi:hypothetical protein
VSAANGRSAERRLRRRRRKLAAATSTVLLVAAAVAGEPISLAASAQVAGGVGGGLRGMTDPTDVGASGRANEDDAIGDYLLDNAGDDDSLLKMGGDAPSDDQLGIPGIMRDAYENAADMLAESQPNCHLDWSLLASIGRIESNHARHGRVDTEGNTTPHILGPVLNGGGFAAIRDSDGGRWDGDNRWDRAVGAMQFIPATWTAYASDGNEDGVMTPHNVFDATLAAGKYLCSGGLDMSKPADRAAAVFRYNHSDSYVATVLLWADAYANGATSMPDYYVPPDDDPDAGYALGPPSVGNTPPLQTPSTNTPAPPNNPTPPSSTLPSPTSGSKHTVPPIPTTTPCTPPPSSSETTTPTTTDPSPTSETPPPSSETPTSTTTTTTTTTPPPC